MHAIACSGGTGTCDECGTAELVPHGLVTFESDEGRVYVCRGSLAMAAILMEAADGRVREAPPTTTEGDRKP